MRNLNKLIKDIENVYGVKYFLILHSDTSHNKLAMIIADISS